MVKQFPYQPTDAVKALELEDYFVWDCSVIKAEGQYHMFSSRWKKELGFGCNWLFNSEIIHSVSDTPEGPYAFKNVVLPRRGRGYFDGMNTHNTCIKEYQGKYYLYYMGTTFEGPIPGVGDKVSEERFVEVWNRKRIGLAVADDINGEFVRRDETILESRKDGHWDATATTNPSVAILPDGKTYMIYKSRRDENHPLEIGITMAETPEGEYVRLSDDPILKTDDPSSFIEDPYLWYDAEKKKFCLLAKDDSRNGVKGITGERGAGFYAESDDGVHYEIADPPKAYSRLIKWKDGHTSDQANLERASLLFDENGKPTHMFFASGDAETPYGFDRTYIVAMRLEERKDGYEGL